MIGALTADEAETFKRCLEKLYALHENVQAAGEVYLRKLDPISTHV